MVYVEPAAGGAKDVEHFIDAFLLVPQPDGIDRRIGDQVDTMWKYWMSTGRRQLVALADRMIAAQYWTNICRQFLPWIRLSRFS